MILHVARGNGTSKYRVDRDKGLSVRITFRLLPREGNVCKPVLVKATGISHALIFLLICVSLSLSLSLFLSVSLFTPFLSYPQKHIATFNISNALAFASLPFCSPFRASLPSLNDYAPRYFHWHWITIVAAKSAVEPRIIVRQSENRGRGMAL